MKLSFSKSLLLICAVFAVFLTACPVDKPTIAKVEKASGQMANIANEGVNLTRALYRENLLSKENTHEIAGYFSDLATYGIAFDASLKALKDAYPDGNVPKIELVKLFQTFDATVVQKLVDVFGKLKLVKNTKLVADYINTAKSIILLIAKPFRQSASVLKKLDAALT